MVDEADFNFGRVSGVPANDTSFQDTLRRTAEVTELQFQYAGLKTQSSSVTSE